MNRLFYSYVALQICCVILSYEVQAPRPMAEDDMVRRPRQAVLNLSSSNCDLCVVEAYFMRTRMKQEELTQGEFRKVYKSKRCLVI